MDWIKTSERLPEENGRYLTLKEGYGGHWIYRVEFFAKDLSKASRLFFQGRKRPGFYYCDSEYGDIEVDVDYWMPLPKAPRR